MLFYDMKRNAGCKTTHSVFVSRSKTISRRIDPVPAASTLQTRTATAAPAVPGAFNARSLLTCVVCNRERRGGGGGVGSYGVRAWEAGCVRSRLRGADRTGKPVERHARPLGGEALGTRSPVQTPSGNRTCVQVSAEGGQARGRTGG